MITNFRILDTINDHIDHHKLLILVARTKSTQFHVQKDLTVLEGRSHAHSVQWVMPAHQTNCRNLSPALLENIRTRPIRPPVTIVLQVIPVRRPILQVKYVQMARTVQAICLPVLNALQVTGIYHT